MSEPLKLGIAGLGTVGTGLLELLQSNGDHMAAITGREIVVTGISARNATKKRKALAPKARWFDDPVALARDPGNDVFVELIGGEDENVEWAYTLKEIALTEKAAAGRTVAKIANAALPIVGRYPAAKDGEDVNLSFYELLLPSGKTGWIDVDGVEPLAADRLCYGKDKTGAWKITGYEQNN